MSETGIAEIAQRSRGTPRIALRLLRRIRDFALVQGHTKVEREQVLFALNQLDIDVLGLDAVDRRYLLHIATHFSGGPVGIETLAAALAEQRDTLEEVIEPYLIQQGFIQRTPRGRMLESTYLSAPETSPAAPLKRFRGTVKESSQTMLANPGSLTSFGSLVSLEHPRSWPSCSQERESGWLDPIWSSYVLA